MNTELPEVPEGITLSATVPYVSPGTSRNHQVTDRRSITAASQAFAVPIRMYILHIYRACQA